MVRLLLFFPLVIECGGSLVQAGQGVMRKGMNTLWESGWETDSTSVPGPGPAAHGGDRQALLEKLHS